MVLASRKPAKPLAFQKEPYNAGHGRMLCRQITAKMPAGQRLPTNCLRRSDRGLLTSSTVTALKAWPPSQIVPILADEGVYLGSERSMYRVLHERGQQHHRGRAAKASRRKPTSHCATGPESGLVMGYHLLAFTCAWPVLLSVSGDRHIQPYDCGMGKSMRMNLPGTPQEMITKACLRHGIAAMERPLVLHSDNGSAMKGGTMLSTLQRLGVVSSFSRPRVSDDNPFAEAISRTLKYRPGYPCKPIC